MDSDVNRPHDSVQPEGSEVEVPATQELPQQEIAEAIEPNQQEIAEAIEPDGREAAAPVDPSVVGEPEGVSAAAPEAAGQSSGATAAPTANPQPGMLVLGGTPLREQPGAQEPTEVDPRDVCGDCGGRYGAEGYCDQCGAARPDESMHYTVDAGHGVGAACDRGIRHLTNEDAVAARASVDGIRRVSMVVSDGVSTAPRAAEASQAAVRAALDILSSSTSTGMAGVEASLVAALGRRLLTASQAAWDAVREVTASIEESDIASDDSGIPKSGHPACTWVAAVVEGDTVAVGSIGDSRAYWFPDSSPEAARVLSTDDSWANEEIRMGVPPEEAERGPNAHTITAWLGVDGPDPDPEVQHLTITEPGWLMVCSDGLWNYASSPHQLYAALQFAAGTLTTPEREADAAGSVDGVESGPFLADDSGDDSSDPSATVEGSSADTSEATGLPGRPPSHVTDADPVALAEALVDWANALGGRDNITVALARLTPQG